MSTTDETTHCPHTRTAPHRTVHSPEPPPDLRQGADHRRSSRPSPLKRGRKRRRARKGKGKGAPYSSRARSPITRPAASSREPAGSARGSTAHERARRHNEVALMTAAWIMAPERRPVPHVPGRPFMRLDGRWQQHSGRGSRKRSR